MAPTSLVAHFAKSLYLQNELQLSNERVDTLVPKMVMTHGSEFHIPESQPFTFVREHPNIFTFSLNNKQFVSLRSLSIIVRAYSISIADQHTNAYWQRIALVQ